LWGLDGVLTPTIEAKGKANGSYVACIDADNSILEIKPWSMAKYKADLKQFEAKGLATTGYIKDGKFYFDKQRDDHRHHALDAVVVACSTNSALRHLSTLHARMNNQQALRQRFEVALPWESFYGDVRSRVVDILVSYKKRIRATTPVHRKVDIVINGEKTSIRSKGLGARGELHKESVYGRYGKEGDYYFHIRKGLESFSKVKNLEKVVDDGIRFLLYEHLKKTLNISELDPSTSIPSDVFFGRDENGNRFPKVYLPNENGPRIPLKKVRIREKLGKAVQWHSTANQWVNPRNNHHVIIGLGIDGKPSEHVVSFWEVVERKSRGGKVFEKPTELSKDVVFMQRNDMFLFPTIEAESGKSNAIYRIQELSDSYYTFRKATATNRGNVNEELSIRSYKKWLELSPLKVRIGVLGDLKVV
jgi:CRISPR-associated endonuclease Csn1